MGSHQLKGISALACIGLCSVALADGTVVLDFGGNTDDVVQRLAPGNNGSFYVSVGNAGSCGIFGLDAQGTLIPTFGVGGRLVLEAPLQSCTNDLLVRPDGSLLTFYGPSTYFTDPRLAIFDATGQLQSTTPVVAKVGNETYKTMALQPDGKILIAGGIIHYHSVNADDWMIRRFNIDGSLDTTLSGGYVIKSVYPSSNSADEKLTQIRALPDGSLLVSGTASNGTQSIIARLNSDGTTDAAFGLSGQVTFSGGRSAFDVDSSGRIYLQAGSGLITRMDASGVIDATYAGGTRPQVTASNVILDSAERLVVIGKQLPVGGGNETGYIARFTTAGDLDTTFGNGGEVLIPLQDSVRYVEPERTACQGFLQQHEKPVVACSAPGPSDTDVFFNMNLVVHRYNADGSLDTTFGQIQEDSDTYPDAFDVPSKLVSYGAAPVESDPIVVSGINVKTSILVNSEFSVGCTGNYSYSATTILPGQSFCVRAEAPTSPLSSNSVAIFVGDRQSTFTVNSSNQPADVLPNAFSFVNKTNVATGAVITSDPVQISGITGRANVTVTGGTFSIGCVESSYGSALRQILNGETVCVRHTSATQSSASVSTQLTVGGVSATFVSTTSATSSNPTANQTSGREASNGSGGGGAMSPSSLAYLAGLALISVSMRLLPARGWARFNKTA